jgi:hypothetical protein
MTQYNKEVGYLEGFNFCGWILENGRQIYVRKLLLILITITFLNILM